MPNIVVSIKHLNTELAAVLSRVRSVKTYESIPTDIQFATNTVANVIRLSAINQNFRLLDASLRRLSIHAGQRVLFLIVDDQNEENNCEINATCFQYCVKLMLCWNFEEMIKYVESFAERTETVQNRIKRRRAATPQECLSKLPSITAPDASRLLAKHKTLRSVLLSSSSPLTDLKGINTVKASNLVAAFTSPFLP